MLSLYHQKVEAFIPGAELTVFKGGYVEEETILIHYPTVLIGSADCYQKGKHIKQ